MLFAYEVSWSLMGFTLPIHTALMFWPLYYKECAAVCFENQIDIIKFHFKLLFSFLNNFFRLFAYLFHNQSLGRSIPKGTFQNKLALFHAFLSLFYHLNNFATVCFSKQINTIQYLQLLVPWITWQFLLVNAGKLGFTPHIFLSLFKLYVNLLQIFMKKTNNAINFS